MEENFIQNPEFESKKLALFIKENEPKYISGELSLDEPLELTDKLYECAVAIAKDTTANKVLQDSSLMQLQSKIVRQCAKSYKPDTLVFDARIFSEKLITSYSSVPSKSDNSKKMNNLFSNVWQKLGLECLKNMHTTPTFNFIYGTFSAEPASPMKKKRKRFEKEKVAEAVKPKIVSQSEEDQDPMMTRATKIYTILTKLTQKSQTGSVCFYQFVTDPSSFTRTIENIFTVSLLVQNGHLCIHPDADGLPCLRVVRDSEKKERLMDPSGRMQSVVSMSVDEWKAVVEKFGFGKPLIPPSRSKTTYS